MAGLSIRRILATNLQSSVMGLSGHFHYGSRPIAVGAARIVDGCERVKRPPGVAVLREMENTVSFIPQAFPGFSIKGQVQVPVHFAT
jgi:hypothetical protein